MDRDTKEGDKEEMSIFAPTIRRIKKVDEITVVDLITKITLISTLSEVTNIKNIESVDLIDLITKISEITNIKNVESIDLIDEANIKTTSGLNIIVDQLTQGAYTERRTVISNNGETPFWVNPTGVNRRGKYFPRGCRGHIIVIGVHCLDNGVAGGTITLYISPNPSIGYLHSATVTVEPEGIAAWRNATFNKTWNYDSLFIYAVCSNSDMHIGTDNDTPYDGYTSADSGATWTGINNRLWFRCSMLGQTVGDVPVSGTISTIEIPHSSDTQFSASNNTLPLAETELVNVYGSGELVYIRFLVRAKADSEETNMRIYCDDRMVFYEDFDGLSLKYGYTATTPSISLLKYLADGDCCVQITLPFKFLRRFRVTMEAQTVVQDVEVEGVVNLIR